MTERLRSIVYRVADWSESHHRLVGAATSAAVAVAMYALFVGLPGSGLEGTRVRAAFGLGTASAGPYQLEPDGRIVRGAPVRVNGIRVGRVESSAFDDRGRSTVVTMRVKGVDVHRDASARIAFRTFLGGNLQIELDPGSPSAPNLGDRVIPTRRTGSQVEFDDFFQPFGTRTRANQRAIFRELRAGLSDPDATGRAVDALGASSPTIAAGMEPMLGTHPHDLSTLVAAGARTARALDAGTGSLATLVDGAARATAVLDSERAQLGAAIDVSPGTLRAAAAAIARIDPTLDALDPLARRLRPGARALDPAARRATPALRQATGLLHDARPLLRDVAPTFDALRRASRSGLTLIDALDPTVRRLNARVLPFLAAKDPTTGLKVYENLGPTFAVLDSGASVFDSRGHFLIFPDQPDANSVALSPCRREDAHRRSICAAAVAVLRLALRGGKR